MQREAWFGGEAEVRLLSSPDPNQYNIAVLPAIVELLP